MTYINDNSPNDALTENIQSKIQNAQHDGKLYSQYIKEQQNELLIREKGRAEGEVKGRAKTIRQLIKNGLSTDKIISLPEMSNDEILLYFGNPQAT